MLDKFKATIWGLAIGDTLGYQVEFSSLREIKRRHGEAGVQSFPAGATFSDDTQMSVALAEGLLDAHAFALSISEGKDNEVRRASLATLVCIPEQVMPYVAKQFTKWAFGPKNTRAPGTTCMGGCRNLRDGKPWTQSGIMHSKGCGSAMRASPVGLVYSDPKVVNEMARASSVITHGHQAALDAAHAAALGVRLLLDGVKPMEMIGEVFKQCAQDERFLYLLSSVLPLVGATDRGEITPEKVQTRDHLGESWAGDEAVASALYCFLLAHKRGEGYVETVRYGANTCGDSDSISAIAGSLAGARWGIGGERGIPLSWIEHVEDRDELELLAQRLYNLHAEIAAT